MILSTPVLVAVLIALAILLIFMALWLIFQKRDPIEERLKEYGLEQPVIVQEDVRAVGSSFRDRMGRKGIGARLAFELKRADIPMTASEFTLIILGVAVAGFALGTWRLNALLGLAIAAVFSLLPIFYMRSRQRRRLKTFTHQLPDMLTLLVGGLRAS